MQLAGLVMTVRPSLPVEATMLTPRARTSLITSWVAASQAPSTPRLRLSARAGVLVLVTPLTDKPAAQRMPARMSDR